ncbi:MAG: T9SS type A sorting domain-containing protein [Bacteroidales bacterium]|nr:T9SS type A sorting domain-containing protein [Bacteroidales bacterium]
MKKKLTNSNQMKKVCALLAFAFIFMECGAQTPWDGTVAGSYDGGDGTPENPYQIATAEQLALFAYDINNGVNSEAHFILTGDINLNGAGGQMWTAAGTVKVTWLNQISYVVEPAYPFMGVFDGDGHVISDMHVDNADVIGLFGCTYSAEVRNLIIENASVTQGASTGIVVGEAFNTDIEGCTVSGEVRAYGSKVGGIAGHYIADDNDNDTVFIRNCVNNAYVTDGVMFLGGIAGYTEMNNGVFAIEHCVNNGEVGDMWNTNAAGGIVGQGSFIIRHCDNYGKVSGTITAGGMVGQGGSFGLIEYCFNYPTGEVTGGSNAGGIIGTPIFTTIRMSGNMATVTGDAFCDMILVGGIAGSDGSISNCFNTGNLIGIMDIPDPSTAQMGGITGSPTSGFVYNVYNAGQIIKPVNPNLTNQIYGRIIPAFHNENDIRNCYYYGNEDIPAYVYNIGSSSYTYLPESSAFDEGGSATSWVLDEAQYGTTDLLEALNAGAMGECVWVEDVEGINGGFPLPQPRPYDAVAEIVSDPVQVDVYPNPGNNAFNIRTALTDSHVELYDMTGRLVCKREISGAVTTIDTECLSSGIYLWKVISGGNEAGSGKWVKE